MSRTFKDVRSVNKRGHPREETFVHREMAEWRMKRREALQARRHVFDEMAERGRQEVLKGKDHHT
jgi:hypothetical protein